MGYLTNQGSIRPTKFSFDNAITIPNRPTIPAFDGTSFNPQVVDILSYQTNTSNVLIPASNFQLGRTFAGSNLNSRFDGKFLLFENELEDPKTYFYLATNRDPLFGANYNVIANIGGRGPGSSVPVAFYAVAPYVENIADSTYTFSFEEVPGEPGKLTNFYIFNLTYRSLYKFKHHFEHEGESDSPSATSYFIANSPTVSKDSVESSINNIFNQAGALNGDVFVVEDMEYMGEYVPIVYTATHSQPYDGYVNTIVTSDEPYAPGGESGPAGGGGIFGDEFSDNIANSIPNGTVEENSSSVGLFTRYAMNVGQMQALADKIYADNFLEKLGLEVTKFLWNSPIDAIISCQSYPFSVTSLVGSSAVNDIKLGAVPTGLSGSALAGSAAKIDWGSISLEEYWKNFLDYAPHTKIELYLPWSTGFVEIDPHECLPGSIGVVTNIEFGKGTCQHIVTGNKGSVIGVFSGVCATTLPLTSIDTASKAVNVVTAAAGLAVAAVTTGVAGAAATGVATGVKAFGAGLTMSSAIKAGAGEFAGSLIPPSNYTPIANASSGIAARSSIAAFRQPPHVVRNGSFNGNGAGMGIQYPFIILSRPTQNVPKNYGHYYGYPSNIYTTLGSVSGYTEVASVHLDGISCTVQEREEIDNLLKGGVIL